MAKEKKNLGKKQALEHKKYPLVNDNKIMLHRF